MQNYLKDFRTIRTSDGEEAQWLFRFGTCSDFQRALGLVKAVAPHRRVYDPDSKLWTVWAGEAEAELLARAFCNFRELREMWSRQRTLF